MIRRVSTAIREVLFDALLDDFGHGEPVDFLIDRARVEIPSMSVPEVVDELRRVVADGLVRVWFAGADRSGRLATDADYKNAVASYVPNAKGRYIISDSLVATLACPGKAAWRKSAEQWQLDLSKHGRVEDDQPGELVIISGCEEMGRQLLAEWLAAHPERAVEEPPRVESANYSLSPGSPESGKRMSWRLVKA
jgi:hypothetical protein